MLHEITQNGTWCWCKALSQWQCSFHLKAALPLAKSLALASYTVILQSPGGFFAYREPITRKGVSWPDFFTIRHVYHCVVTPLCGVTYHADSHPSLGGQPTCSARNTGRHIQEQSETLMACWYIITDNKVNYWLMIHYKDVILPV